MPSLCARSFLRTLHLLVFSLLSACGGTETPQTANPPVAPVPPSFVPALLRTGLVADRHRRWLLFADTTRQEIFRLGHTPREVRAWLADYEERIEKKQTLDPDSLQLHMATAEQMRHPPPPPPMVTIIRFPYTPAAKALAHKQTIQLTHQLQQAGLLTAAEYRRTLPLATGGLFYSRRNLLMTVNEMALVAEGLQQSDDLPPTLQRLDLLTKAQSQQLAQDLRAGVFTDPVEVLLRLPHARMFNRHQYPTAMLPYLEQLHRDVAKLLPGLQFTNFRVRVITPGEMSTCINCDDAEDVLVQLNIGTKEYSQRSEWQPRYSLNGGSRPEIDANQFYHIFNQALADQGSPHRLVFVESEQAKHTIGGQFGLWCLTAPQAEALDTLDASALQLEAYGGFEILPTDTVAAAFCSFQALGFLRRLGPAQRLAAAARTNQARLQAREEVLRFVPGSVGEYRGDPQYRSWSYVRLLEVLRHVSDGRFTPTQVRDGCQQADGTLGFQLGKRTYTSPLYQANESPDSRLFQLVQRALREQHIPGKFYLVSSELAQTKGMVVNYVFLSPTQERIIRQKHLLNLNDPTLTDEQRYAQEEATDSAIHSGQ